MGYKFPKATLKEGLRLWLQGATVSDDGVDVVKPYRCITSTTLPRNLQNKFKLHWLPIFRFLETGNSNIPDKNCSNSDFEIYYNKCIQYLKSRVSYCFEKKGHRTWSTGTWSVRIQRSSIVKNGTEDDKAQLGTESKRNRAKCSGKRNKKLNDNVLYPRRQRRRANKAGVREEDEDNVGLDNFMTAFEAVEHKRAAEEVAHDDETLRLITEEIETDLQLASESGDRLAVLAAAVRPVVADTCRGCGRVCRSSHKCDECGSNMHPFCGRQIGEEGYGQIIRCRICDKQ